MKRLIIGVIVLFLSTGLCVYGAFRSFPVRYVDPEFPEFYSESEFFEVKIIRYATWGGLYRDSETGSLFSRTDPQSPPEIKECPT